MYIHIYYSVYMLNLHIYMGVISCFSDAVIKHHDQGKLQKEENTWASREMSSCHDDGRESW